MGSTFSHGNNVFCYLPQNQYHGGDVVNGFVCLNCVTPFSCLQVLLRVEAYEKTSWTERTSRTETLRDADGTTRTETLHDYQQRSGYCEFFKVAIPLHSYPQTCMPGQYQFPFQFILPVNLPGSFELTSGTTMDSFGRECTDNRAKICYKVKAECVVPGMLKANIRCKQSITVFQRLLRAPTSILANHSQQVTTCCCCNKGMAHLTAHIDKDSYVPGDTASITLQVDNQSEIDFREIRVYCSRTIKMRASGCEQQHDMVLSETGFPGIKKFTTQLGDQARHLRLVLPCIMLPTTYGSLIECSYRLIIRCKTPACTSDVELKVPLTIYVPPPPVMMVQPPPFWQPTVIGVPVQLSLPAAPPIAPYGQAMTAAASCSSTHQPEHPAIGVPISKQYAHLPSQDQQQQQQQWHNYGKQI